MNKFLKGFQVAAVIAGTVLTTAFAGPASASTRDFLGRWLGDGSDGPDLVKTVFIRRDRDGDRIKISLNDWGTDTAILFCKKADCDSLREAKAVSGKFQDDVHSSYLVLKEINDNRLSYDLFVNFADGSRPGYVVTGTLVRANDNDDGGYDDGYGGERHLGRPHRRNRD